MDFKIRDLVNAVSLLVDGQIVQTIEIDEETSIEGNHGNLDISNSLAAYIQSNGVNAKQKMSEKDMEKAGITGNCYLLENVPKLSMYHKYAKTNMLFDLVVTNQKIVLKRVF